MKKITLFALLLIGLVMSAQVKAQDLVVTNNTSCAIDVTLSSVDQVSCSISTVGPTTVNAGMIVTIPGPLPNGVVYKAQGTVSGNSCSVVDCRTNGTGCNPPGTTTILTCTISTTLCGAFAPTLTLTAGSSGSNSTLVIN